MKRIYFFICYVFLVPFLSSCNSSDNSIEEAPASIQTTDFCASPYDATVTMDVNGKHFAYDARAIIKSDTSGSERYLLVDVCSGGLPKGIPILTFESNQISGLLITHSIKPLQFFDITDNGYGQFRHGGATCIVKDENGNIKTYELSTDLFYYQDEFGNLNTSNGIFDNRSHIDYSITQQSLKVDLNYVEECDLSFRGVLHGIYPENHNDSIVISNGYIRYAHNH